MICVMHVNRRSKTDKYANSFVIIFTTKHFNLIIRPSVLIFLSICISMLMLTLVSPFLFLGGMFLYSTFLLIKSDLGHVFEQSVLSHVFCNQCCMLHAQGLRYLPNAFFNWQAFLLRFL